MSIQSLKWVVVRSVYTAASPEQRRGLSQASSVLIPTVLELGPLRLPRVRQLRTLRSGWSRISYTHSETGLRSLEQIRDYTAKVDARTWRFSQIAQIGGRDGAGSDCDVKTGSTSRAVQLNP